MFGKNYPGANLAGADFTKANLTGANFTKANLTGANFTKANLTEANFTEANLTEANFTEANLTEANLTEANLTEANLTEANLTRANLDGASLFETILAWSNLSGASMKETNLSHANLDDSNLSGVTGLLSPWDWLTTNFVQTSEGFIVYKRVGNTSYISPQHWKLEPGAKWEEEVNPNRTTPCGSGVNFGTLEWCLKFYKTALLYKMLLPWEGVVSLVVPYNTNGVARTSCLIVIGEVVAED